MTHTYDDKYSAADVAIIGLGPGGLAATLVAAASGKNVIAFSDRSEYVRGQRLVLTPETIAFLKKHNNPSNIEDQLFWQKYTSEKTAQTKDIEKYLFRKLKTYPNAQIIQLEKPDKITAVTGAQNPPCTAIVLSNGQTYYTRNILASDGARHSFADLLNENMQTDIQYSRSPVQERHKYHGVVQLRLKYEDCILLNSSRDPNNIPSDELTSLLNNKDGCILHNDTIYYYDNKQGLLRTIEPSKGTKLAEIITSLNKDVARMATFKEHKLINNATDRFKASSPRGVSATDIARRAMIYMKQGWSESFEPKRYVFTNADRTKFYFAGEIPKLIFEEPDQNQRNELLQKWSAEAIKLEYGYSFEQLEYKKSTNTPAKNKLQATVFEMEMQVCQTPLVRLEGGVFAQVGDARRTPNYNLGHGLNDAIAGGIAFVNALGLSPDYQFNEGNFLRTITSMDRDVESAMTSTENLDQKVLLKSIDKLIKHLEKKSVNIDEATLMSLKWARHEVANSGNINKLNESIRLIQSIVDAHQHRDNNLGYKCWRWVASIFYENATNTRSANLLSDINTKKDKIRTHFGYN